MTLDLTTDFSVNNKGFKAAWKEVNWMWLVANQWLAFIQIYSFLSTASRLFLDTYAFEIRVN